jgi:tRNA (mo5U34)-methyltransferase
MEYKKLLATLKENNMDNWSSLLGAQLFEYFSNLNHGDYPRWKSAVDNLPEFSDINYDLNSDSVLINSNECDDIQRQKIKQQLLELKPWRKGPFNLFNLDIDTEWRSNWKWDRFKDQIKPLDNKLVLDIGCGNGYYGWRMLGQGAKYVVGMDPTLLFLMQFLAVKKYLPDLNLDILPFGVESLPDTPLNFDTVFSMGVIYHRRQPMEHLKQLLNCLKPGGELVLETLVYDTDKPVALVPKKRYAKMNNVWSIPSCSLLSEWAEEIGFKNIRIIDVTRTTTEEQRQTDWMTFESLCDFLDKQDNNKTIEGHLAPIRAILLAEKP